MPLRDTTSYVEEEGYDYDHIMSQAPDEPIFNVHKFDYPGPVAFNFAASNSPVRLLMGPYGSGKTSAGAMEHLTRAIRMPFFKNGWREYKGLVVRDSYRNLYKTSIPSWWEWYPPEWPGSKWSGGQDRPAQHIIEFEDDYGPIRLTMDFAAIGDQNVETFFKGYAVVGVQVEEADGLPSEVIDQALGRAGRFPKMDQLRDPDVGFWRGVWGTLNAPDFDHWIYKRFVEDLDMPLDEAQREFLRIFNETTGLDVPITRIFEFFKQPGGLTPQAENIQNLPPGYYHQMMGNKKWWIRRFVHNEFGYSRSGEPVYLDEFDDDLHFTTQTTMPVPGIPVDISIDGGGHPAAVFSQKMPSGQRQYQREIVNRRGGVGPKRFAEQINHMLDTDYAGFDIGDDNWADPSMFYGGDEQVAEMSEKSFGEKIKNLTEIKFKPAPSNEILIRLDAVREALDGRIDGDVPEVVFCKSMKMTRQGFNSKYAYRKDPKTEDIIDGVRPNKLPGYSDVQDCVQYQELGSQGLASVQARSQRRKSKNSHNRDRRSKRRRSRPSNAYRGGFQAC